MDSFMQEHVWSMAHWPFMVMTAIFWLMGHFFETSVFTKARVISSSGVARWILRWGRESMEIHPVFAGTMLGILWVDPEGRGWGHEASMAYFAGAGVASLFFWLLLNRTLERFGLKGKLRLPGESAPPPSAPPPEGA